jgi:hypothetical protein
VTNANVYNTLENKDKSQLHYACTIRICVDRFIRTWFAKSTRNLTMVILKQAMSIEHRSLCDRQQHDTINSYCIFKFTLVLRGVKVKRKRRRHVSKNLRLLERKH